mmetsp:Transcript_7672/g.12179  ORF Transcript_7672/g.12179 Transcript_7672/m.12179 type:complete len:282 (-) Transcript_7672:1299-2144(-)
MKDSGPAKRSGKLQMGDMIKSIDGVNTDGMRSSEVTKLIVGEVGTQLKMEVERPGTMFSPANRFVVELIRNNPNVETPAPGPSQVSTQDKSTVLKVKESQAPPQGGTASQEGCAQARDSSADNASGLNESGESTTEAEASGSFSSWIMRFKPDAGDIKLPELTKARNVMDQAVLEREVQAIGQVWNPLAINQNLVDILQFASATPERSVSTAPSPEPVEQKVVILEYATKEQQIAARIAISASPICEAMTHLDVVGELMVDTGLTGDVRRQLQEDPWSMAM